MNVMSNSLLVVNNFFGIEIFTPYEFQIDDAISLYIYTNYSSDHGMTFFGFKTMEEMDFFNLLISVPGLGAKTAIKLLHSLGLHGVANCIYNKDHNMIMKIPGIGNKIANRIINDLASKIARNYLNVENTNAYDILSALVAIGYDRNDVLKILSRIPTTISLEEKLKEGMILLQQLKNI